MDEPQKTTVLGTGLSGLIGSRFQKLYQNQYKFENLDLSTGVDITDAAGVDKAIGTSTSEIILHLAAYTNVSAAYDQNGDITGPCYQINVNGTKAIALAAKKYHKHLIHISTDFVFDGTKQGAYTETDTPHPIEWYGETKLLAEKVVQEIMPDNKWTILRLAYPYQNQPSRPDFLAGIIDKLENNSLPPAFTDHVITPTFADDLAKVFAYVIKHRPIGLFHTVGSSSHTDYELALMVKENFNLGGEVKPGKLADYLAQHPRPYQHTMQISNVKLTQEFGIKMKTFQEGLEEIKRQISSFRISADSADPRE